MKKDVCRSCRNKKKYGSQDAAQQRATFMYRKGLQLKPYLCPVCRGWHLTKINWRSRLNRAFAEAGLDPVFVMRRIHADQS